MHHFCNVEIHKGYGYGYMFVDLFSGFDSCNIVLCGGSFLMWLPMLFIFSRFILNIFVVPFEGSYIFMVVRCFFYYRAKGSVFLGFFNLVIAVFVSVLFLNFYGLVPGRMRATRHIYVSIRFAVPMWMSMLLSGIFYNCEYVFSQMLPCGIPEYLVRFVSFVELVSTIARSMTLSLRLVVNTMAGHVLLGLMARISGFMLV